MLPSIAQHASTYHGATGDRHPTGLSDQITSSDPPPTHDYVAREVARTVLRDTNDLYQATWAAKGLDQKFEAELCRTLAQQVESRAPAAQQPRKKRKRRHFDKGPGFHALQDQTDHAIDAPFQKADPAVENETGGGPDASKLAFRHICTPCGTRDTARWRNGRNGKVCNACGIAYLKERKKEQVHEEEQEQAAEAASEQQGETDGNGQPQHEHFVDAHPFVQEFERPPY